MNQSIFKVPGALRREPFFVIRIQPCSEYKPENALFIMDKYFVDNFFEKAHFLGTLYSSCNPHIT
ncbi:hypothetical protein [uncultured Oscillibacter sp.]|uniref:hypothetical protein n=1 Tax=uncultured Oscillibacter sp. TaxID=876091 RepID=UPI0025FC0D50|nr:hypothetical protein [uncultured Oscillibacter sp.]